jgi:hypothetical protein
MHHSRISLFFVALVLALLPTLAACTEPVDVSPSSVFRSEDTTATAGVATTERPMTAEQRDLQQAQYIVRDDLTGIELFATLPVERCVMESQLIIHGTVTRVGPTLAGAGDVANPYIVFSVEPEEVLKGSPRFGTPVAFALLLRSQSTVDPSEQAAARSPVAAGDEVLLFSYASDKDLATGLGSNGAYLPWNDRYGIYLPVGDEFVDVLRNYESVSLEEVRALVGSKTTSTTLPPGYLCFNGKTARFEDRLQGKRLAGTLPYQVLPAEELGWLSDSVAPASMTAAKGYGLANGDLVFLWDTFSLGASSSGAESSVLDSLEKAAIERYGVGDEEVWAFWYGQFGYLVVSKDHVRQLGYLAQMAETGAPLN